MGVGKNALSSKKNAVLRDVVSRKHCISILLLILHSVWRNEARDLKLFKLCLKTICTITSLYDISLTLKQSLDVDRSISYWLFCAMTYSKVRKAVSNTSKQLTITVSGVWIPDISSTTFTVVSSVQVVTLRICSTFLIFWHQIVLALINVCALGAIWHKAKFTYIDRKVYGFTLSHSIIYEIRNIVKRYFKKHILIISTI